MSSAAKSSAALGSFDCAPEGFHVVRTPLLAVDEWTHFGSGLRAAASLAEDAQNLEAELLRDLAVLRPRLSAWLMRPEVREALFLASPSLESSLPAWHEAPDSERGQKVERSLVRYFARMTGRATPFGLFAGYSPGGWAETTELSLGALSTHRRHSRLDNDFLHALVEQLEQKPGLRSELRYRPNGSLYEAGGRLSYAEARSEKGVRSYHLVAVEPSPELAKILEHAQATGGARRDELAALLSSDEISIEEATDYVEQLIDHQLLLSDLPPSLTGAEPIHELIARLGRLNAGAAAAQSLDSARAAMTALDEQPLGAPLDCYRKLAENLGGLVASFDISRLFQVDLAKPEATLRLGRLVREELLRGTQLLHRISPPPPRTDLLDKFRTGFIARYGDREVPLLEALDEELGIGFGETDSIAAEVAPLLAGLPFPEKDGGGRGAWDQRQEWLLGKLHEVICERSQELSLDSADLDALAAPETARRRPLPTSCAAIATLLAESAAEIDAGRFRLHLHAVTGPSGANLLGRFCHGDPQLTQRVRELLRAEERQRPEAVFAEIIHLPEGRLGNILLRPVLREYELPYLGSSGAPPQRQLPAHELRVSVRDGRVVLRSERLGREIIPRLTTAHNVDHPRNLGVYRFFCALQRQDCAPVARFDWGVLESSPFLPRVRAGRLILAAARWRLSANELRPLARPTRAARFAAVQELRSRRRLPRRLAVTDGDNLLPVDLDNVLCVETMVQLIKDRAAAIFTEQFVGPDDLCVRGPGGRFAHELVVPLLTTARYPSVVETSPPMATTAPRSFVPGSEWLYAKFYTGAATADLVIQELYTTLVQPCLRDGACDRWFFIRYGDPDWHVRLRLHGDPRRLREAVLPAMQAVGESLLARRMIWRLALDTYDREVERYGGPQGIELAERIFHADSEACVQLLRCSAGDAGAEARWKLTLLGIDMLLDGLLADKAAQRTVMRKLCESFRREFEVEPPFLRSLGERYRSQRVDLTALRQGRPPFEPALETGLAVLHARSRALAPWFAELRECEAVRGVALSCETLVTSYIHMHCNRMLRSRARAQELVLYEMLTRLYDAEAATRAAAAV